jgi:rubrerythrin
MGVIIALGRVGMAINSVLDQAVDLELRVSEAYRKLSWLTQDETLRSELKKLADEEIGHANLVRAAKAYASHEPDLFAVTEDADVRLRSVLNLIGELLGDLDKEVLSLKDGLRRIAALENHCERLHVSGLLEIREPSLRQLFIALASDDKAHRERLERLLAGVKTG